MAILDETGRLQFAVDDMRLISELTPAYLQEHSDLFSSSSMVFLDANLPAAAIRTAFSLANKAGIPVCADPTSASLAPKLKKYLPRLHLVTPNATEAGILTGNPFPADDRKAAIGAARMLVGQGVDIAIVTLAEFGVCYATSETNGHIPAIRTEIIDPTGAGDAMTAAILFGLLNELSVDDAIRLGVSAASLTLRSPGTVCAALTLEKLYDQLIA
jgi:pseudouridine kinase